MNAAPFLILFLVLILGGVGIAIALGFSSLVYFFVRLPTVGFELIPQKMFAAIDSTALTAIPLFILAGELMNFGGITVRIVRFASSMVGHIRGGLSYVTVIAAMFFGGVTGSAIADTTAVGSVTIPAMVSKGYRKDFSAALVAAAGSIGPIIPPSIPMILYGSIVNVSIGKMFLGGYIPGIIIGFALMGLSYIYARREGHPAEERKTLKEMVLAFFDSFLALLTPVAMIGGIVLGIVTPTEAGMIGVVYAFLVATLVYRVLKIGDIPKILVNTAITSGVVLFVFATASIFGWVMAFERIPQIVAQSLVGLGVSSAAVLALILAVLLVLGMFLDGPAIIIIMTPVLYQVIMKAGIDPVFFGVLMCIDICIGTLTPPVGVCLFVAAGIARVPFEKISYAILPFIVVITLLMFLFAFVPILVMWLPNLLMP